MTFIPSSLDWSHGSTKRTPGLAGGSYRKRLGFDLAGAGGSYRKGWGFDLDLDRSSSKANNPHAVRRYIGHMSSLVADPIELDLDQRRLQNAVNEAGENSIGVDAIAVWMVDEDSGKLIPPSGGWWRSPNMEFGSSTSDANAVALARLEDSTRDDYEPPTAVSPGTDLSGILWAESRSGKPLRRMGSEVSLKSQEQTQETTAVLTTSNCKPIRWRDIKSISQDPDSAKGPRLKLMEEAGFTMAAGITFQYMHHQGMVVFLTTVEDENDDRLTSTTNGAYLYQAAQLIGATLSLAEIRRASVAERYKLKKKCYSMRDCNADYSTSPSSIEEGRGGNDNSKATKLETMPDSHQQAPSRIPHRVIAWSHKLKGGSMQIPPSMSWKQTLWTIFGSFVGLILLSALNQYYRLLSDNEYHLLLGPFGAMMTLMYGLSAAPASQPRNAVMGQAIAGGVSLAFTYIPEHVLPVWVRTAVGPAFAIGFMVKLGVVHPPAGASSVLFASGRYNFGFYGLVVLSTALSVIPATVINNMSSKRQYPTYWGLGGVSSWLCRSFGFLGHGQEEIYREDSPRDKNIDTTRMVNLTERDEPFDGSNTSNKKLQPNGIVVHEEDDESRSHGDIPSVISIEKDLAGDMEKVEDSKTAVAEKTTSDVTPKLEHDA